MHRKNLGRFAVAFLLVTGLTLASAAHAALLAYQVTATPSNIIGNDLLLDIPVINSHPAAQLIITQNYTPTAQYNGTYTTGTSEPYLDDPVGVRYDPSHRRWFIYDETGAPIPVGASFNILAAPCERVLATALNSLGNATFFPLARDTPGALLFITHFLNPVTTYIGGVDYPHPSGIDYNSISPTAPIFKHWFVSSEDSTPAEATAWFVFDSSPYKRVKNLTTFTISSDAGSNQIQLPTSRTSNTVTYTTTAGFSFTNSALNGNASAVVFITHFMNGNSYNQVTGVYYNGTKWCIVAPSFGSAMDEEAFNVVAFAAASP
jgi:hypothetical protein